MTRLHLEIPRIAELILYGADIARRSGGQLYLGVVVTARLAALLAVRVIDASAQRANQSGNAAGSLWRE